MCGMSCCISWRITVRINSIKIEYHKKNEIILENDKNLLRLEPISLDKLANAKLDKDSSTCP